MAGSRVPRRVKRLHSERPEAARTGGTHAALAEVVQRVLRQEAALYRIASLGYQPFSLRLREITRLDATTLDVARVSFWSLKTGPEAIHCEELYLLREDRHEAGSILTSREFPRYFKALKTGQPIAADDAHNDPRTSEFTEAYLRPTGIGAMLDVPVFLGGTLHGVVCHEHLGPARSWTRDEQLFAMSVGQSIALSIEAERRDQTERALRDSEHRFKAILEASPIPMAVSLPDGEMIYANAGMGALFRLPVDKALGKRAVEFYADRGVRDELLAEIDKYGQLREREVQLKRGDGSVFWAMISSVRVELDGRQVIIASIWDITSKREAEEKLRHAALYDELTGLPNRTLLFDLLRAELARVDRHDQPFAMLYMDLDDFKQVNDRFGHEAGDALLREVASRIRSGLRAGDVPARVGGDEFVALLPQVAGVEGAKAVADRVAEFLNRPHVISGTTLYCPASVGILMADNTYKDANAVMRDADAAMYKAKQAGKSRTRVFSKE
jgi:diguanylate cyclase (GGDEF)-like protein/PAS domain S-box-containing protein